VKEEKERKEKKVDFFVQIAMRLVTLVKVAVESWDFDQE